MADTFEQWASKQVHNPNDEISNLDKLKAPYLINKYKTWGDVYKAAGIKAPKEKPKAKKQETAKELNSKIKAAETRIARNESELFRYEPGSADYNEIVDAINNDKTEVKGLQTRLNAIEGKEFSKQEEKNYETKYADWKTSVDEARKAVQIARDTDGDVAAAEQELNAIVAKEPKPKAGAAGTKAPTPEVAIPTQAKTAFGPGVTPTKTEVTSTANSTTGSSTGSTTGKSTGKTAGQTPNKTVTDAQQREEALNVAAGADFALPETIFNNVPSLKRVLERYVKEDWTPDQLRKAIRDDVWFRKNSAEIKARYVQLYNYQDLVKSGQAQGTTDYEKQIATLERQLADKARKEGSALASDPTALRRAAENMYITNVGIDDPMTMDFIVAAIKPVGTMIAGQPATGYSGAALENYQKLQSIAKRNGFKLTDIVPDAQTELQVLQGIASGRMDINRITQDTRKLAAQGQPQYVRDLLGQGYDLQDIYAPYRTAMAKTLEINPDQIDLTDPTLRMAITDKGDMNLYDFSKALRKDNRWQYTANAKEEVANATLQVLRDFGFQG